MAVFAFDFWVNLSISAKNAAFWVDQQGHGPLMLKQLRQAGSLYPTMILKQLIYAGSLCPTMILKHLIYAGSLCPTVILKQHAESLCPAMFYWVNPVPSHTGTECTHTTTNNSNNLSLKTATTTCRTSYERYNSLIRHTLTHNKIHLKTVTNQVWS